MNATPTEAKTFEHSLIIFAAIFFLCVGAIVFVGLRTDAGGSVPTPALTSVAQGAAVTPQPPPPQPRQRIDWSPVISSIGQGIWMTAAAIAALGIYFLPGLIANKRRHRERTPIFLVNLFFGWSVLGWIFALIWSTSSQVEKPADGGTEVPPASS